MASDTHWRHYWLVPRGHGREERRTLKVVTVTSGLLFPHVIQAMQIKRQVRDGSAGRRRTVTVYAITDLPAWQASPADLATWPPGSAVTGASRSGSTTSAT
ncbi:hypothetical protein [Nonomuraea antimicrobica]|uniref:hypothetical protein n=1 Tax=Nonomuraea antimicrobica TaxID=561173 RepID=UPI0031ED5730